MRPARASLRSVSITDCAWNESRPEVGSSRKTSGGSFNNSTPMLTRLRSPPDTPRTRWLPTRVSAHATRPSSEMISSTRRARASSDVDGGSRRRAANAKVSRTVERAKSASSCSTYAEIIGIFPSHGTPLTSTEPWSLALRVIGTRPASVLRSDVLPLPLGPMIARRLAASSEPETSERISFVCFFCLIVYVTLRHESSAAGFERCSATTVGFSTATAVSTTTVGGSTGTAVIVRCLPPFE